MISRFFWRVLQSPFLILKLKVRGGVAPLTAYTLLYSTAGIERIFSVLSYLKEPKRNRMYGESLEASLIIYQDLMPKESSEIEESFIHKGLFKNKNLVQLESEGKYHLINIDLMP